MALIRKAGLASDTVGDDRRERHWALSVREGAGKEAETALGGRSGSFREAPGRTQAMALKEASYLAAHRLSSG